MTLVYRCNDETAEWVAKNSGTTAKSLTKLEEVETDGYGAETWKGRRMIGQEEDYYIPVNRVLAVEERVGIMQTMFELSRVLFTCWVPVQRFYTLPARPQTEQDNVQDCIKMMVQFLQVMRIALILT